jgi:hypothetical protein
MSVDFRAQLADQLDFIQASCDRYNQGAVREGVRIATALRVIFHQTMKSTSLLTHLNAASIDLLSTCDVAKHRQSFFPGMTTIKISRVGNRMTLEYAPKLQVDYERPEPFNKWWFQEIVYLSRPDRLQVTRKDLVTSAANKDGGAHVDKTLDPMYERVLEGLGWKLTDRPNGEPPCDVPCRHGHLAALRQMGYEALNSPDLLGLI